MTSRSFVRELHAADVAAEPRVDRRIDRYDERTADRDLGAEANRDAATDTARSFPAVLAAAVSGDQVAFAVLYRERQPRLLRYASGLVGQDAEDVTAEAWLQIARDLRGFAGDLDAFRGWTARIVRNRALDLARKQARRPARPMGLDAPHDSVDPHDAWDLTYERITTDRAIALIATLPAGQAEAVLLRAVVGLDAATAGAVLGKPAGTVRVSAHRGLKALARRLRAGQTPDDPGNADRGTPR